MNKSKVISFILAFIMIFTVAASAVIGASAADMALSVSKSSESGGVLKVAVNISNNKGFKGMGVIVNYDSSVLTPTSSSYGGALSGTMSVLDNIGSNAGSISFVISEKSSGKGSVSNGALVIISFKEKSSLKSGTKTTVSASCNANNTYDLDQNYTLNVGSGSSSFSLNGTKTTTTTKKVTTTKKKVTTTKKKVTATTKKTTVKVNAALSKTTAKETTTVESTTENIENTTEYYTEPEVTVQQEEETTEVEKDSGKNKVLFRCIAVVVIVVCAGAAAVIYVVVKKDKDGTDDTPSGSAE